jgi:hypothetical protein
MNQNSTQPGTAEGAGRHTPGDWTATNDRRGIWEIIHDGDMLAQVWAVRPGIDGDLPAEANARLMAAAPDLLAALKFMLGKLEVALAAERRATLAPYPKSGVEYVGADPADCEEVKQARAAIAKAEGK